MKLSDAEVIAIADAILAAHAQGAAEAFEKCAEIAEQVGKKAFRIFKGRDDMDQPNMGNPYYDGKSDGAHEAAVEIRAAALPVDKVQP